MFNQVALAAILIVAYKITAIGQPVKSLTSGSNAKGKHEELLAGTETAKAIERLGGLSSAAIRERLNQMRQPANVSTPLLVNKIVEARHLAIASGKDVDHLRGALQPVLAYHRREQMPIIVVYSVQPRAFIVDRLAIVVTTRLMILANNAEIRGIVAHELGHEYVWNEHQRAREEKNGKLMQECELFCDAVAAFTLKEIGDDPASYGRILERMAVATTNAANAVRQAPGSHPSLTARKELNKLLCQRPD